MGLDWLLSGRLDADGPDQPHQRAARQSRERLQSLARVEGAHIVSRLRQQDPSLDLDAALESGRRAFLVAMRAENLGRPDIARQAMTEAGWQQLQAVEANYQLQGERLVTSDVIVTEVRVVDGRTTAGVGQLVLDVWAAGRDGRIVLGAGAPVANSERLREWVERITINRDADVGSPIPACPNCGSPLQLDPDGHCSFCQALPPGTTTQWLIEHRQALSTEDALAREASLVEVPNWAAPVAAMAQSQPEATVAEAIAAIRRRDPGFSDRALVIEARSGWLLVERAYAEADASGCRALLIDACWQSVATEIDTLKATGEHRVHGFLEIDDAAIIRAGTEGGRDRVTIRVQMRSTRCRLRIGTDLVTEGDDREVVPWALDIVMERAATAVTPDGGAGFLSGTCPACAAALAVDAAGACVSCHRRLTGGDVDWVIAALDDVRN